MRGWKLYTTVLVIVLIVSNISIAQTKQVYFRFTIESRNEIHELTKLVSIDNIKGDTVYAYSTNTQFERFAKLGYEYEILPNPGSLIWPKMTDSIEGILEWDTYPTYSAYVAMMYQFAVDYPDLCLIQNIGTTTDGHALLFAKISDNVNSEEAEPEVMYSSSMHGDELVGYVLMLRLIDYLLVNYGTDPQATSMVDNLEIWINPLANPDGTYMGGDNTVNGSIRYNANWVDLNRNYPDPEDGPHPDGHEYQPETLAMLNFLDQHNFVISANFHGGIEVVNYPWDTWPQRHADDSWFIQISRDYADLAQANSPSGYMTDLDNGITNGWDWYEVNGGRQDYMTWFKGGRETTIELSTTKLPQGSRLPDFWTYNRDSMLGYLQQADYGIRGLITNYHTGQPLAATITVLNHDIDNAQVYSDPDFGDYYRMIDAGTYDLQFSAVGYITQTVYGVSVSDYGTTIVDVQLVPDADPVPTLSEWGMIIFALLMTALGSLSILKNRRRSGIADPSRID